MRNMNELVEHIFGSLNNSERTINDIQKCLAKQARYNLSMSKLIVITQLYIALGAYCLYAQGNKIRVLSKEIKELRQERGE